MTCAKSVSAPFVKKAPRLCSGERIELEQNTIKDKTYESFTAELKSLDGGARLIVGHGYMEPRAGWVEITETDVSIYNFYTYKEPNVQPIAEHVPHGLSISDYISVVISKNAAAEEYVLITTRSGQFKTDARGITGYDGSPLAMPLGVELTDACLSFSSEAYGYPIWIYGDSYLNHLENDRWPYYLYRDGYSRVLLSGFPGEGATRALVDFKTSLTRGTPRYALWLLGMNNGDGESAEPSPAWLESTEEFLRLCDERGITPILSTIPQTPKINNLPKNAWVRASGRRYIDFNRAVGADRDPAWLPEMLHTDDVHPLPLGAKALYERVLTDFPEIMEC